MSSVHDVAAYIIRLEGNLSTMKLQKLCYYAQGWHLAWQEEALFEEPIEAWRMGPVCPTLYRLHKGQASVSAWPNGSASNLSPAQRNTVNIIVEFYRPFSGFELGKRTHQESPWIDAYEGAGIFKGSTVITRSVLMAYFKSLSSTKV